MPPLTTCEKATFRYMRDNLLERDNFLVIVPFVGSWFELAESRIDIADLPFSYGLVPQTYVLLKKIKFFMRYLGKLYQL